MSAIATTNLQDIDVLLGKVSAATGLSVQAISKKLASAEIQAFRFNDTILISPNDFDGIIDTWAENIKAQLSIKPISKSIAPVVKALEDDGVTEKDEAIEEAETPTQSLELAWPKGFENSVTHLYTHTFQRILPKDPAQKQPYLEAIANETETGKRLADELVNAIVTRSKRKLASEKVRAGLIAKCAEMLALSPAKSRSKPDS